MCSLKFVRNHLVSSECFIQVYSWHFCTHTKGVEILSYGHCEYRYIIHLSSYTHIPYYVSREVSYSTWSGYERPMDLLSTVANEPRRMIPPCLHCIAKDECFVCQLRLTSVKLLPLFLSFDTSHKVFRHKFKVWEYIFIGEPFRIRTIIVSIVEFIGYNFVKNCNIWGFDSIDVMGDLAKWKINA